MDIQIAKDSSTWNKIVEKSPYSVLHHKYEMCALSRNALPLIIREGNRSFLFPLRIVEFLKSFRLATSPIYSYATLLPESETLDLVQNVLDYVSDFLQRMGVDYLSTCGPTFLSRRYAALLTSWFKERKASVQVIYSYVMPIKNATFEEIQKARFRRRTREEIKKAKKEGVGVIKIDSVDGIRTWINGIYRCNVSILKRQGRWGAYPDSYKDVVLAELISAKRLLKEHFNIYGATFRGRLIAYVMVREYKWLMDPTKAASDARFWSKHPNDVLMAHLVKEACERGFYWLEYGFDRVKRDGKIPSLYPGIQGWRRKFGFEEIPIPIYYLGLTRAGSVIRHLFSFRDYIITRSAYIPESARKFFLKFYAPRHRRYDSLLFA